MSGSQSGDETFLEEIRAIADEVAAPHADAVDREARFPHETLSALRERQALSAFVDPFYGGRGVSLQAVAKACYELGRRCGASAMVYAMHQIQVTSIARHLEGADWHKEYLRALVTEQRLIASATSEVGTGGDLGTSIAAMQLHADGSCTFEKQAPTVSYGAHADDLFTTLRRTPDSEPGDQVVVLTRKEQNTFEQTSTWDPMGMRGTCSPGFVVKASFAPEQALPAQFQRVAVESMVPITHILWSQLWLGIAFDAFDRARSFVRAGAKQRPGQPQPAAQRLSRVMTDLSMLRAEVECGLRDFCEIDEGADRERLSTMAAAVRFNNLKIAASEQAPRVCQGALGVCGIVGFKNDTPFSVGRHLRDTLSASLMITNERIHETNASLLLIAKEV